MEDEIRVIAKTSVRKKKRVKLVRWVRYYGEVNLVRFIL